MSEEQSPTRFEEKAQSIINWTCAEGMHDFTALHEAIATALEAAYQEGRESEAAMNELVKIGQEIDKEPTDV